MIIVSIELEKQLFDESTSVRKEALRELLKRGHPELEKLLIKALKDESSSIRSRAAEELVKFQSRRSEEALIAALDDPWWIVRFYAIKALIKFRNASGREVIIEKSCNDLKSNIRKLCAESLPRFGSDDPQVVKKLSELMKDKVEEVRSAAITSMEQIGSDESRAVLKDLEDRQRMKDEKRKELKEIFGDIDG